MKRDRREYMKKYIKNPVNKERKNKYDREYNEIHKKELQSYRKQYYKIYYQRNKDKIKEQCNEYHKKNKKEITEEQRKYNRIYHIKKYHNDIQHNLRVKMCNRFRRTLDKYKKDEMLVISKNKNVDYKAIIEHLKPFPENIKDYHIDHIIPLDYFDLTKEEHLKKAWNPINFQWLKIEDNIRKSNIIDFEKYPIQKEVLDKLIM